MANFKLKESADKTSLGTALAGVNIIPQTGFIMPYAGTTAPSGWALCNGLNGTPDLKGYFLIGATSSANLGAVTGSNTHTHSYAFSALDYSLVTNTHEAPAYVGGLDSAGAVASHTHVVTTSIDTASHTSSTFINWSNGNTTNRTFRSHDHVGNVNHNSAAAAEPNHTHNSSSAGSIAFNVGGVVEAQHMHNSASSPSGTSPTSTTIAGNIIMNYIIKV